MRIAISNIAWDVPEDAAIAALLAARGVDAIDVAPGKYFPEPSRASDVDIGRVKRWWSDHGIEVTGMQALLFGTTGLNIFGDEASRTAMLRQLGAVCRIGAGLGATRLVFGSPRNRDRAGLDDTQALATAVPFFRDLGERAAAHGVLICLEPNPPRYGANFMTTSAETARVVDAVAHPAIRMQLDTGSLAINGEEAEQVVAANAARIGHIHASEPDLVPLGDGDADHAGAARAVARHLPGHVVAIEMVATKDEPHTASIARAVDVALRHYGAAP